MSAYTAAISKELLICSFCGVKAVSVNSGITWWLLPSPNAYISPVFVSNNVWFKPTAMSTTLSIPSTLTGEIELSFVLFPSWPLSFLPQAYTSPFIVTATINPSPTTTFLTLPFIATVGVVEYGVASLVSPIPSWPYVLSPHVYSTPPSVTAAIVLPPTATYG